MIHVVGSRNVQIHNIELDGAGLAYAGVHFEHNQNFAEIANTVIDNCRIGIRNGTRWDHDRNRIYWGLGGSPYYRQRVLDPPSTGGWQADGHYYRLVKIRGCNICISQESQQAIQNRLDQVAMMSTGALAGTNNRHALVMCGGSIVATSCASINTSDPARSVVRCFTGANKLQIVGWHDETRAKTFYQSVAAPNEHQTLVCDGYDGHGDIVINCGGGRYSFDSSWLGTIRRRRRGKNRCYLAVQNSRIVAVKLTGDRQGDAPTFFEHVVNTEERAR